MIKTPQLKTSAVGSLAARSRGVVSGIIAGLLLTSVNSLCADVHQELADLRIESAQLKRQNASLVESLAEANKREKESADALAQIRQRMEALGKNLIDGKDDRMVKAVSDIQVLNQRVSEMENASMKLSTVIQDYAKTALHADPAERTKVEAAIRELDVALGLRHQPQRAIDRGSLDAAKVVSIDSETGLLVLNVGAEAGTQIGMKFAVERNSRPVATAIIAETRKNISGALVQTLTANDQKPKIGDFAVVQLQKTR